MSVFADPAWLGAGVLAPLLIMPLLWLLKPQAGLTAAAAGALPALVVALVLPAGTELDLPWLMLGARLALDPLGATFLLFTALLWLFAGVYAAGSLASDATWRRFAACFVLAMAGNFGLIVAGDVVTFYTAFALMSFASYGLVIHRGDTEARRAARIYMVLVVIGEVALFAGMAIAAISAETLLLPGPLGVDPGGLAVALLIVGFGIKAGLLPLHVWLPLAHPAAPIPASAVLSGAMIKAGLIGLVRFLPVGAVAFPSLGETLILAGLAGAFFGVVVGLTQTNPKTILAYSSISQMGLMITVLGIVLAIPAAAPGALLALAVIAFHHGLAKGALFLACGVHHLPAGIGFRLLIGLGLILPALALVGAPLTSGQVAKTALDGLAAVAPGGFATWLPVLLPAAAIGTGLLMTRFLIFSWPAVGGEPTSRLALGAWGSSVIASAGAIWLLPEARPFALVSLDPAKLASSLIPLIAAGALVALVLGWRVRLASGVPPGDLLVFTDFLVREKWIAGGSRPAIEASEHRDPFQGLTSVSVFSDRLEMRLREMPIAGGLLITLILVAVVLLAAPLVD